MSNELIKGEIGTYEGVTFTYSLVADESLKDSLVGKNTLSWQELYSNFYTLASEAFQPKERKFTDDEVLRMGGPLYSPYSMDRTTFAGVLECAETTDDPFAFRWRRSAWPKGMYLTYNELPEEEESDKAWFVLHQPNGREGVWSLSSTDLFEPDWECLIATRVLLEEEYQYQGVTDEDIESELRPLHLRQPRREGSIFPW